MSALDLISLRERLGGTVYDGGRRWVGPGPGHSKRDTSLSVVLTNEGRPLVHSFAGDAFAACAQHIGLERGEARPLDRRALDRQRREREAAQREREAQALRFCEDVWSSAQPIAGTAAEVYLRSRGLAGPFPGDLRFHSAAPLAYAGSHRRPALVALVRSTSRKARGLHVTALRPDGLGKAAGHNPRRMFGPIGGGAVQLAPAGDELAIAEGIETALSFTALHEVPSWAALSTSGLRSFEVPSGVRRLIIAADADDGGAGVEAARFLAERARRRCEVVILPAPEGKDWNDALRELEL